MVFPEQPRSPSRYLVRKFSAYPPRGSFLVIINLPGGLLGEGIVVKPLGGQDSQLWRCLQIDLGRGQVHMAHVSHQIGQQVIGIETLSIPLHQFANSEGVPQSVQPWAGSCAIGVDPALLEQPVEARLNRAIG